MEGSDVTVKALPRAGDLSADEQVLRFRRILAQDGAGIARLVRSYAKSRADEEDLAQEVTTAIWKALKGFRAECSERTFAYRIAHNQCITLLRRRRIETEVDTELADKGPSAEDQLLASERRTRLERAVANLPLAYRQVVVMALEELSHREIGDVLGITDNAVAIRLNRGKRMLSEALHKKGKRA